MKILEVAINRKRVKECVLRVLAQGEFRGRYEIGKQEKKIKV